MTAGADPANGWGHDQQIRLYCGACGKSCGRVLRKGPDHAYVGQLHLPATQQTSKMNERVWAPVGGESVSVLVTCTSGHRLNLECSELIDAMRAGHRTFTVGVLRPADPTVFYPR